MSFDLSISNQSEIFGNILKASMYKKLYSVSDKGKWVNLSGIVVGTVSGIITVAVRVALIFENFIKGTINFFGSIITNKYDFSRGLQQIFIETPKNIIILPFSIIGAAFSILSHTFQMAYDPVDYTYNCWYEYDPVEKKRYDDARNLRQQQSHDAREQQRQQVEAANAQIERQRKISIENARVAAFNNADSNFKADENNLDAILVLAIAYENGHGVKMDYQKSFEFYERAANLGHINSMVVIGEGYEKGLVVPKDIVKAVEWIQKAKKGGYVFDDSRLFDFVQLEFEYLKIKHEENIKKLIDQNKRTDEQVKEDEEKLQEEIKREKEELELIIRETCKEKK